MELFAISIFRIKPFLCHFIFVFMLLLICLSCKEQRQPEMEVATVKSNRLPQVDIAIIKDQAFNKQLISNGKIEARQKSELRFKLGERLAKILVVNGQKVGSGQLLAQLDNQIAANDLKKAKIDLDKAKAKLEEEKINYGKGLIDSLGISEIVLNNLKYRAGLLEAENALIDAQLLLDQTYLRAPFSGLIANIENKQGDFITNMDPFCTIVDQNNLDVVFSILEGEFSFVSKGQAISVIPFSDDSVTYFGSIIEINPLVDENGLIKIKATINDSGSSLFDGMNVKVFINKAIDDVVVVPKEALVLRSNREVVFTLQSGNAKWNYVEVVDENDSNYAIKADAVKVGDSIIVSGNLNLAHDAQVKGNLNSN